MKPRYLFPALLLAGAPALALAVQTADPSGVAARDRGPAVVVIDELSRLYGPVTFDHELHAEMSQLEGGCANCHHDARGGEVIAACSACHAAAPSTTNLARPSLRGAYHRQCLGCHRDWSHENACGFCHEEVSATAGGQVLADPTDIVGTAHPRIAARPVYVYRTAHAEGPFVTFHHVEHAAAYGLRCADCHRGASCDRCHDTAREPAPSDCRGRCLGCHAERNCGFCHDTTPRPAFDHATSVGWDLKPHHEGLPCASCHGPTGTFRSPPRHCRACHDELEAGTFDHRVTGVPLCGSHEYFECGACHRQRSSEAPAVCDGCHADKHYPPYVPGRAAEQGRGRGDGLRRGKPR